MRILTFVLALAAFSLFLHQEMAARQVYEEGLELAKNEKDRREAPSGASLCWAVIPTNC